MVDRIPGRTAVHWLLCLIGASRPDTQTTEAEQRAIQHYAQGRRRALEIGVFEGLNTALIARALSEDGELWGIDPFIPGRAGICWGELITRVELARAGVSDRVRLVKRFSHDAATVVEGVFDFAFIDGDHSYNAVRTDWADWSDRIAEGGIIALHDTRVPAHNALVGQLGSHRHFEEVVRNDPRFVLLEQVDSLSILRRLANER